MMAMMETAFSENLSWLSDAFTGGQHRAREDPEIELSARLGRSDNNETAKTSPGRALMAADVDGSTCPAQLSRQQPSQAADFMQRPLVMGSELSWPEVTVPPGWDLTTEVAMLPVRPAPAAPATDVDGGPLRAEAPGGAVRAQRAALMARAPTMHAAWEAHARVGHSRPGHTDTADFDRVELEVAARVPASGVAADVSGAPVAALGCAHPQQAALMQRPPVAAGSGWDAAPDYVAKSAARARHAFRAAQKRRYVDVNADVDGATPGGAASLTAAQRANAAALLAAHWVAIADVAFEPAGPPFATVGLDVDFGGAPATAASAPAPAPDVDCATPAHALRVAAPFGDGGQLRGRPLASGADWDPEAWRRSPLASERDVWFPLAPLAAPAPLPSSPPPPLDMWMPQRSYSGHRPEIIFDPEIGEDALKRSTSTSCLDKGPEAMRTPMRMLCTS